MTRLAGYARNSDLKQLEVALEENQLFREAYEDAAAALISLRSEDVGWVGVDRLTKNDGRELKATQEVAEYLDLQTTLNPLLKRGFTLRRDNVFGRGVMFQGETPVRAKKILEKPYNENMLFTEEAFESNERALFVSGNLFLVYDIEDQTFIRIPLAEITNYASNPKASDDVWYFQRTFTEVDERTNQPKPSPTVEWYPVLERWEDRSRKPLLESIANQPVNQNFVLIDLRVNRMENAVWGVPDSLSASPYAWAHAEYIRDASKLLKALQLIAWKITAKSKGNTLNAAAKMALPKKPGSTAAMTDNTDLVQMPRAGSVDMKDGLSLAGYVASALEVSLVALTSDPGTASGSYGAAATLDVPSANSARTRQALWVQFYKRIYRALGVRGITVNFPKINTDPIYRTVQSLQIGFASGAIHQDEYRAAYLEATDVVPLRDSLPEPTVFTSAAAFSAEALAKEEADREAAEQAAAAAANVQGVGRSDGVGVSRGDNDLRDADATPGTGS